MCASSWRPPHVCIPNPQICVRSQHLKSNCAPSPQNLLASPTPAHPRTVALALPGLLLCCFSLHVLSDQGGINHLHIPYVCMCIIKKQTGAQSCGHSNTRQRERLLRVCVLRGSSFGCCCRCQWHACGKGSMFQGCAGARHHDDADEVHGIPDLMGRWHMRTAGPTQHTLCLTSHHHVQLIGMVQCRHYLNLAEGSSSSSSSKKNQLVDCACPRLNPHAESAAHNSPPSSARRTREAVNDMRISVPMPE